MARKTQVRMSRRKFSTKYISDAFIEANRAVFEIWTEDVAQGYRKIVSNWSKKPQFIPRVEFQERTGRFFARVQIAGDPIIVKRFEGIDFGARRSGIAKRDNRGSPTMRVLPSKGQPRRGQFIKGADGNRDFKDSMKEFMSGGVVQPNPGFRRQYMPMRLYIPKTTDRGDYGGEGQHYPKEPYVQGSGQFGQWRNLAFVHRSQQGDIRARQFTIGLAQMVQFNHNPFGIKAWNTKKVYWTNTVRRAYARGVRQANAQRNR